MVLKKQGFVEIYLVYKRFFEKNFFMYDDILGFMRVVPGVS